jgi:hypothetical protein
MKIIDFTFFCLFLFSSILLATVDGTCQGTPTNFNNQTNTELVSPMIYFARFDDIAVVDGIIIEQFLRENDTVTKRLAINSTFYNKGIQPFEENMKIFSLYDSTPYFAISENKTEYFKQNIAHADSFRLRNQDASIWFKMKRAVIFIGGTELICMGILMAMPKEVTKWQPGFLNDAKKNLKQAFTTPPVNDKDNWKFNYVGHPIAGSLYYNSIRSQNATIFQSFVFSFAQSAIWEYLIEGMAEQPSLQDLIITPIFGTLLGEASHSATIKMRRNGFNWLEKITVTIINPFYVVNNGYRTKNKKVVAR